jgi:hypothetical protein
MPWTDEHLKWLVDTGELITTKCGKQAKVYHFDYDVNDHEVMGKWAKHFRNHYCSDGHIDALKTPGQSRAEYLLTMKFPSQTQAPGPSIRAGDFAEILVADYLTYFRGYCVPRTRYDRKGVPNESTKGSDVLAFKSDSTNPVNDELLVFEVKAKLTGRPNSVLQEAIDHSGKDYLRLGESLNGIKQRMFDRNELSGIELIDRFQDSVNRPYATKYGGAAVCSNSAHDRNVLAQADAMQHPYSDNLELIAIHGEELMSLAHTLFERAANEV